MKLKNFLAIMIVLLLSATASFGTENETQSVAAPAAFIPADKFEFEPVIEGVEVVHDFIIQNKGNAELNIENVKPG